MSLTQFKVDIEPEAHTNGVVPMPVKTITIECDEVGYPGWKIEMRLNPRSEAFDIFVSGDEDTSWEGFKQIVVAWNFGDENGVALPLPKDGLKRGQLPSDGLLNFIYKKYFEEFNSRIVLPKPLSEASSDTSQTGNSSASAGSA
jgi:hypothetical protein